MKGKEGGKVNGCGYYTKLLILTNHIYLFFTPSSTFCLSLSTLLLVLFCCRQDNMATLQSLAFSTNISHCSPRHPSFPGLVNGALHCAHSSFIGQSLQIFHPQPNITVQSSRAYRQTVMMVKPAIQFIQGTDELTVPDVKLTKSRDGSNGMAIFKFEEPSVFDSSGEVGDITGMYMIDEEGVIQSVDVNAKFVNGKPAGIEAKHIMRTPRDWDRFMRFMERYANQNGLQFVKK